MLSEGIERDQWHEMSKLHKSLWNQIVSAKITGKKVIARKMINVAKLSISAVCCGPAYASDIYCFWLLYRA